jgi:hypothetical protein
LTQWHGRATQPGHAIPTIRLCFPDDDNVLPLSSFI